MEDYSSNSHKAKEGLGKPTPPPEKKVKKLVTGEIVKKKKPMGSRFKEMFFAADFDTVGSYVVGDVVLPKLRDLLFDVISNGAGKAIYNRGGPRPGAPQTYAGRTQYNNITNIKPDPRTSSPWQANVPDQPRIRPAVKNIGDNYPIPSREEAENILDQLIELIDTYQAASLADFFAMLGLESSPIDNKWGWTVMQHVTIQQTREGYVIQLPPLEDLS